MSWALSEALLASAELTPEEWRFVAMRKGIGRSSDALIAQAILGSEFPTYLPMDNGDLGRCETTYEYAPWRLRVRMSAGIALGRRAVAERGLYCRSCDTFGHGYTEASVCRPCIEREEAA